MTTDAIPVTPVSKATRALTSYDLLKAAAVLLMIVDHAGYYFFPEENWFRVIGRFCVPVWFFLIGYARSRDLSPLIWIGTAVLVAGSMLAGQSIFPLNVLGTMIFVRLVLDPVMRVAGRNHEALIGVSLVLLVLAIPTYALTEYGTHGLIMAMFGYILRNHIDVPGFKGPQAVANGFFLFTVLCFVGLQELVFGFGHFEFYAMCLGIVLVNGVLFFFRPVELPKLTAAVPGFVRGGIQLLGRYTLEIYVAHLLLFKAAGVLTDPERFSFLQWTLFWQPPG